MPPLLGEIEIRIFRQLLRGVEIGRAVDHVRALRIPDAADIGERLEAVERNAALGEGLGRRKAGGPGADDAVSFHGFHRQITAPIPLAYLPVDSTEAGQTVPLKSRRGPESSLICIKSPQAYIGSLGAGRWCIQTIRAASRPGCGALQLAGLCLMVSWSRCLAGDLHGHQGRRDDPKLGWHLDL